MSIARKKNFLLITTLALVLTGLSGITPLLAHTSLLIEVPAANSQIDVWPSKITLEFDESLQNLGDEKANFLVVNNAAGDQVSNDDELLIDNTITVSLSENQIQGPVLVYYRVVSGDGHPVEGEYTFTYGVGVETAEGVTQSQSESYPIAIYIASAIFIVSGLFFAIYSYRRRSRI
ncbi:MAG: copper resistance protein CopC [Candidatus Nanopelagicus sp.]